MHLITFVRDDIKIGVLDDEHITDISSVAPNMLDLVRREDGLAAARAALRTGEKFLAGEVQILAPIPRPSKNIFCVGKNYHEHAQEFFASGFDNRSTDAIPESPIIFSKAPTTVIGPGATIPAYLDPTETVDYEIELGVVIGRTGRRISREHAMSHIFGYTIVNDVTSRDLQKRHQQWFIGKSIDGFCPMGPAIVTADSIPDVGLLRLTTRVNGEIRQNAAVADLIFDIPTLIEVISQSVTLEAGDIIATGTPAGVGIGFSPPQYLKKGDVVACIIDGIGTLENSVE